MKDLKTLGEHPDVSAVYSYEIAQEQVPIVIVEHDYARQDLPVGDIDRIIILTHQEVETSHDVFALQFAHMQRRATLVSGEDILHQVHIDHDHLRRHMELLIRQTIIDRRELELVHKTHIGRYERESVYDRLGVGLAELRHVEEEGIWTRVDTQLGTTFVDEDDLDVMYHNYQKLLDHVDSLG